MLVVWLPFFIFPYIGLLIIPIDFHVFQRGGPTTNQLSLEIFGTIFGSRNDSESYFMEVTLQKERSNRRKRDQKLRIQWVLKR